MKIGMLWFDANSSMAVEKRVDRAASYYHDKYGQAPTLCLVNPAAAAAGLPARVGEVELRTLDTVLPHHFWLGIKPQPEVAEPAGDKA